MKFQVKQSVTIFLAGAILSGCGVKGNPEPPDTPPPIGRGQPTYRRATESLAVPNLPPVERKKNSYDDSDPDRDD